MSRSFALLPAAGIGTRMGAGGPKQYLTLAGRTMLWHAIHAFEGIEAITRTYVVLAPDDGHWGGHDWSGLHKLSVLRCGGASRAETVLNGLRAIAGEVAPDDWVLVHDAARPCVSGHLLHRLLDELEDDEVGGILAAPVADTLKREDGGGRILETVARERLWGAQTPQMFRHALLLKALEHAGTTVTDEASAVEALGLSPRLVESDMTNLKVTWPRDIEVAEWLLSKAD
ncbi:MAG: 2-C-methyl-D-erythritol 4-phosphate cytidylyltransferase [Thiobacillus sp.]|nr:2-C-methyl-D-erythritol 4-phosphate cytidylyltransferase [Thiobacillus sp.]